MAGDSHFTVIAVTRDEEYSAEEREPIENESSDSPNAQSMANLSRTEGYRLISLVFFTRNTIAPVDRSCRALTCDYRKT